MRSLVALLVVPLMFLTACGGESSSEPESASGSGALGGITVTGKTGAEPKVDVEKGFSVKKTEVDVLTEGEGEEVGETDLVTVDYVGINGKTGNEFDSSWSRGEPASFSLGPGMITGFNTALAGQKVGSRVLTGIPPADGYGEEGNPQIKVGGKDSLIFVIDIRDTSASQAQGKEVKPPAGLPALKVSGEGVPQNFVADKATGPASKRSAAHVLIKGAGAKVRKGQKVTMHYLLQVYPDKKVLDSSWARSPLTVPVGDGKPIACLDQLVGQTVGSRVALVCPPAEAFGKQGNPQLGLKGTDTVLFAVDVLAAN